MLHTMQNYVPINELPSSDTLNRSVNGTEPDTALAFDMVQSSLEGFARHRFLWDVVLPEGANDNDRIQLNMSRLRTIRLLGGYSLIHIVDTSRQDLPTGYLDDGGIENGVSIGVNMQRMTEWTRGRYKNAIPLMKGDRPTTAEDAFWADELEGVIGHGFEEALKRLSPIRRVPATKLTQLPGLFKLKRQD